MCCRGLEPPIALGHQQHKLHFALAVLWRSWKTAEIPRSSSCNLHWFQFPGWPFLSRLHPPQISCQNTTAAAFWCWSVMLTKKKKKKTFSNNWVTTDSNQICKFWGLQEFAFREPHNMIQVECGCGRCSWIYHGLLSVPQKVVMNLNSVMLVWSCRNIFLRSTILVLGVTFMFRAFNKIVRS